MLVRALHSYIFGEQAFQITTAKCDIERIEAGKTACLSAKNSLSIREDSAGIPKTEEDVALLHYAQALKCRIEYSVFHGVYAQNNGLSIRKT